MSNKIKKIDKLCFIKMKSYWASKEIIKKVKRQNGKKYLKTAYDKGLLSRIVK